MAEWIHRRRVTQNINRLELEQSFTEDVDDYSYQMWERRDCKVALLGYLVHDDHCSDPLEDCDGMGKIITKHSDKSFLLHVGRDEYGEPILDEQVALLARLRGEELYDFECDTDIVLAMWEEASKQGKVGTPYAVALSFFDHQGYEESEGRKHRWQSDAVWIPDKYLIEHLETLPVEGRADAARTAYKSALDEYNKRATGDCWGVVVDVFERHADGFYKLKENDACWGYIGGDYAQQTLKDELARWRKTLSRKSPHRQEKILGVSS